MRYHIRHLTRYTYTEPLHRVIQMLRLTPRQEPHQQVLRWSLVTPGAKYASTDAYGNVVHLLTVVRPDDAIEILVDGEVALEPRALGQVADEGKLPPLAYAAPTALTRCTEPVQAFCHDALPEGLATPEAALRLAAAICQAVHYEPGVTDVTTPAERVLELGHGVCQDHAHLFLACARGLGVPARYVSGYLTTESGQIASHAWVDVALPGLGWCSLDVTHQSFTDQGHCRLAVARDYDSAAPVRGVRRGGGIETLHVEVQIQPLG